MSEALADSGAIWPPETSWSWKEDWIHELHPDLQEDMDAVVALSGVRNWLLLVRVPQEGKLDAQATMENLGITLTRINTRLRARGETFGVPLDDSEEPLSVNIDPWYDANDQRLTMGHEMGHLYLEALGYRHRVFSGVAEAFCDAVAKEAVLPLKDLEPITMTDKALVAGLAEEYGVNVQLVITQLMQAGKLPHKVAVDSGLGPRPNAKLSDKICRAFVCYECINELKCAPAEYDIPVFDFTDRNIANELLSTSCRKEPDYFWNNGLHDALTNHYFPRGRQLQMFDPTRKYARV